MAIVKKNGLPIRQTYTQTLNKLSLAQRFRSHPKNLGKALKADKKVKTIAGRLVRELERNLPVNSSYDLLLSIFNKILSQKRGDSINIMMAAAAFNFKRAMRALLCLILQILKSIAKPKYCYALNKNKLLWLRNCLNFLSKLFLSYFIYIFRL